MLLIITCGALAVIGLLLCVQCWRLGDRMFFKEAIYTDALTVQMKMSSEEDIQ